MPDKPKVSLRPTRLQGNRVKFPQHFAHGAAQAAGGRVFLGGDHAAGAPGGIRHQLPIQRLQAGQVQDPGSEPLVGQQVGGGQTLVHHEADTRQGDIVALPEDVAPPQLKRIGVVMDTEEGMREVRM